MIDIYHTRRAHFQECRYWIRQNTPINDLNKWVLQNKPKGIFYAKPRSPITSNGKEASGVFLANDDSITLMTSDYVEGLEKGCVVLYSGKVWMVTSIQRTTHIKESEFESDEYTTYISIRR